MRESGVGRVLVASLHQAIADLLPTRLSFYESWLTVEGLRDGTIGLAPLLAVLSFLRQEGAAYDQVTRRAGDYAAEWTSMTNGSSGARTMRWLPGFVRRRMLLRKASAVVRMSYASNHARWRIRRSTARVELRSSVFCEVREPVGRALCGFYAALFERTMTLAGQPVTVSVESCRGAGDAGCVLAIAFVRTGTSTSESSSEEAQ